jgi:hypothetical protein
LRSEEYQSYNALYSDFELGLNIDAEVKLCVGLGAATCTKVLGAEGKVSAGGGFSESTVSIKADRNQDNYVSLTTTYTVGTSEDDGAILNDVIMVRLSMLCEAELNTDKLCHRRPF